VREARSACVLASSQTGSRAHTPWMGCVFLTDCSQSFREERVQTEEVHGRKPGKAKTSPTTRASCTLPHSSGTGSLVLSESHVDRAGTHWLLFSRAWHLSGGASHQRCKWLSPRIHGSRNGLGSGVGGLILLLETLVVLPRGLQRLPAASALFLKTSFLIEEHTGGRGIEQIKDDSQGDNATKKTGQRSERPQNSSPQDDQTGVFDTQTGN
jgi:hypothetical protein